jgi:hypothetical protein
MGRLGQVTVTTTAFCAKLARRTTTPSSRKAGLGAAHPWSARDRPGERHAINMTSRCHQCEGLPREYAR